MLDWASFLGLRAPCWRMARQRPMIADRQCKILAISVRLTTELRSLRLFMLAVQLREALLSTPVLDLVVAACRLTVEAEVLLAGHPPRLSLQAHSMRRLQARVEQALLSTRLLLLVALLHLRRNSAHRALRMLLLRPSRQQALHTLHQVRMLSHQLRPATREFSRQG